MASSEDIGAPATSTCHVEAPIRPLVCRTTAVTASVQAHTQKVAAATTSVSGATRSRGRVMSAQYARGGPVGHGTGEAGVVERGCIPAEVGEGGLGRPGGG